MLIWEQITICRYRIPQAKCHPNATVALRLEYGPKAIDNFTISAKILIKLIISASNSRNDFFSQIEESITSLIIG